MTERRAVSPVYLWVGGGALAAVLIFLLSDILTPFVAGFAIAYFLDPLADWMEKKGIGRGLAVALILGVFLAVLVLLALLLAPLLQEQIIGLIERIPDLVSAAQESLNPLIARARAALAANGLPDLGGGAGDMAKNVAGWLQSLFGGLLAGGKAVFHVLSLLLIMPLVAFYLLRDWDRIVAHLDALLPRAGADTVRAQVARVDETLSAFVRGQATVCFVLAVIYGGGLTLAGLDFGLLIGVATGLLSFIPYFGMGVGLIAACAVAVFQFSDPISFVMIAAVFAVGQMTESFFLTPRLLGGKVGLHPLWIVFALMAGASLFGFTGVLLAVPVAAVLGTLIRFWAARCIDSDF